MRRSLVTALVLPALALSFAGCGQQEATSTPVACLESSDQWLTALHTVENRGLGVVDEQARIVGDIPISECIPPDQPAGQQETVGRNAVEAASILARGYRTNGNMNAESQWFLAAEPAWEAGYLVGALQRGAEGSQGIHATLLQRVQSAATNGLGRMSRNEQAAYKRGFESGLKSG